MMLSLNLGHILFIKDYDFTEAVQSVSPNLVFQPLA
jgi:hypothetical protein